MPMLLCGKTVGLRPFEITDIKKIASWLNDSEATRFMFYGRYPTTDKQVEQLFQGYLRDKNNVVFMIVDISTNLIIGFSGIFDIDYIAKKAEPRMLIGEKQFWGQSYGMEIAALLTHYGFEALGLNKLYGGVARPDNKGATKFFELLGYKTVGLQKEMAYRNGTYYDGIMIDILRNEYYPKTLEFYQKNFKIAITKT